MSLAFAPWELAYLLRFIWVNFPPAVMIPTIWNILRLHFLWPFYQVLYFLSLVYIVCTKSYTYATNSIIFYGGTFTLFLLTLVAAFFYRDFSYSVFTQSIF
ncbi:MAG: hypothetical protein CM1200mP30_08340 [Pseudomonadota bacterium]|nr:MAG: hypothetical protein CM1200mP30_08340 [Pseudomonadota bacterium]